MSRAAMTGAPDEDEPGELGQARDLPQRDGADDGGGGGKEGDEDAEGGDADAAQDELLEAVGDDGGEEADAGDGEGVAPVGEDGDSGRREEGANARAPMVMSTVRE